MAPCLVNNDPVKKLWRLIDRGRRHASGHGTFGHADVRLMRDVMFEVTKKLDRLVFLEEKVEEMVG